MELNQPTTADVLGMLFLAITEVYEYARSNGTGQGVPTVEDSISRLARGLIDGNHLRPGSEALEDAETWAAEDE